MPRERQGVVGVAASGHHGHQEGQGGDALLRRAWREWGPRAGADLRYIRAEVRVWAGVYWRAGVGIVFC